MHGSHFNNNENNDVITACNAKSEYIPSKTKDLLGFLINTEDMIFLCQEDGHF